MQLIKKILYVYQGRTTCMYTKFPEHYVEPWTNLHFVFYIKINKKWLFFLKVMDVNSW